MPAPGGRGGALRAGMLSLFLFSSVRCRWLVSKRESGRCEKNREDQLSPEISKFSSKIPPKKGGAPLPGPLHPPLQA